MLFFSKNRNQFQLEIKDNQLFFLQKQQSLRKEPLEKNRDCDGGMLVCLFCDGAFIDKPPS
jgi:hypothetical protein